MYLRRVNVSLDNHLVSESFIDKVIMFNAIVSSRIIQAQHLYVMRLKVLWKYYACYQHILATYR